MEKRFVWLFCLLLLLTLCACGPKKPAVYDVEYGSRTYTVDTVENTITVDGNVCACEIITGSRGIGLQIAYPDGSTYFKNDYDGGGTAGGSADYDPARYVSGDAL